MNAAERSAALNEARALANRAHASVARSDSAAHGAIAELAVAVELLVKLFEAQGRERPQ